ncbi:MAG: Ribosomal RNA small subunit methyltransferase F [Candidatus Methanofastidiosum methylothiophilum]|uniref:Ribosomal RNA small subunit methyltransferase F n=1 Tax=Candidatus Methanofastidiosum methylothiophilum TaxID=1705564 RepID=A0A150J6T4_9EURY|nr:MAG: Ribosomal RNA small subunit methyltransferase F [Candidatus Methanofastidiosum methylthiophilus]
MRLLEGKKLDIIKKTIEAYGGVFELSENNLLAIVDDDVFLVNKLIYEKILDEKIKENLVSIGTQIGKFQKGNFLLGLECSLIMASSSTKSKLNEKGASLFLYGRDVFVKNMVNPPKKGYTIVSNIRNEVIGIGKFDGKMLNNVIDRGSYLRTLE